MTKLNRLTRSALPRVEISLKLLAVSKRVFRSATAVVRLPSSKQTPGVALASWQPGLVEGCMWNRPLALVIATPLLRITPRLAGD
ncbi:hypothetical protein D3C80_1148910 [compost metagenome]